MRGEGSAPGKVILCGEHSVVYGRPAIAVPVSDLRAHALLEGRPAGSGLRIVAADLGETLALGEAPAGHPLAAIARSTLAHLAVPEPDARLTLRSDLPIAAGLGSGAAVSVAVVRALAAYHDRELSPEEVSALVYEVEKLHHGTPSGIDNTVVAFERPVYFVRGREPETFAIGSPFHLLIANSGIPGSTRDAVLGVRHRWLKEPVRYQALFDEMGAIAEEARGAIEVGDLERLGRLLDDNQLFLQEIGVSLPELDELVERARQAGALGAKLTGGGAGGNVIALVPAPALEAVERALAERATQVWATVIRQSHLSQ
ncbi:MAG: mevalonate kinase [Anaerolineales bacterium]